MDRSQTPITRQWVLNLFAKGYDTLTIAGLLGVDESRICNALVEDLPHELRLVRGHDLTG